MKARPLASLAALSVAIVAGCGSVPPSGRAADGVAPIAPVTTSRSPGRPSQESAAQFEPTRNGSRLARGGATDGTATAGVDADGVPIRSDVKAVRDRILADADLFEDAPGDRRSRSRGKPPTDLNDRRLDEQPDPADAARAGAAAHGSAAHQPAGGAVRRGGPSAVPLPGANGAAPATPPTPLVPPAGVARQPLPPAVAGVPQSPAHVDAAAGAGMGWPGKTEVAVGGAELPIAPAGPGVAGNTADPRFRGNGNPPVEVTVYGNNAADLEKRLADKAKDAPQDPAAQFDYQLYQLLKTDAVSPLLPNAALSKEDRNLLSTLATGLVGVRAALGADGNPTLSEKVQPLLDLAEQVRGMAVMTLPSAELCKEVRGFGQFDPVPHRFLAGADHRVIVYCEVQNFTSRPTQGQFWETKLSLDMTLATNDGTIIWNDKSNVPVDVSRNRRHDFFLIKHMQLPKTLAVGKYILKLTVTDEHAKRSADFISDITMTAQ